MSPRLKYYSKGGVTLNLNSYHSMYTINRLGMLFFPEFIKETYWTTSVKGKFCMMKNVSYHLGSNEYIIDGKDHFIIFFNSRPGNYKQAAGESKFYANGAHRFNIMMLVNFMLYSCAFLYFLYSSVKKR